MPETDRVKRNIGKMIDGGASEGEIDTYIASEGVTLEDINPPSPTLEPNTYRGTILPFERNLDTGETSLAVPGIFPAIGSAVADAATLPGDVYSGKQPIRDEDGDINRETIERSTNLGLFSSPMSPASRVGLPKSAEVLVPKKAAPLTEGQQVATSAQRLGVDLPRAVSSDSMAVQQGGKLLANVPVAGNPLRKASQAAIGQLDDAARSTQTRLGSGSVPAAGADLRAGIEATTGKGGTMAARATAKYERVDRLVDPTITSPLKVTQATVQNIAAKRSNARIAGESQAIATVKEALARREGLNYEGLKDLRTSVGEMLKDTRGLPAGTSQKELKQIYGALTTDLRAAVAKAGGKPALQAFNQANKFYDVMAAERKALTNILRVQSDEAIVDKMLATAGQTSRANMQMLRRVKGAVSKDTWNELGAAAISRMGRAPSGEFSPQRFLTSYGKMSPGGKVALFDKTTMGALDDIARVSTRFKQLNQFANPSGTTQTILGPAAVGSAYLEPVTTLTTLAGAYGASKLLARPTSAKLVADWAKASERMVLDPSTGAKNLLAARSQPLALLIAKESGGALSAANVAARLQSISRGAAEDDRGDSPNPSQQPNNNPRPYDPRLDL